MKQRQSGSEQWEKGWNIYWGQDYRMKSGGRRTWDLTIWNKRCNILNCAKGGGLRWCSEHSSNATSVFCLCRSNRGGEGGGAEEEQVGSRAPRWTPAPHLFTSPVHSAWPRHPPHLTQFHKVPLASRRLDCWMGSAGNWRPGVPGCWSSLATHHRNKTTRMMCSVSSKTAMKTNHTVWPLKDTKCS